MQTSTKLRQFVVGQRKFLLRLLRTVRWRDVLWFLLGWVLMLLIPPEEEGSPPPPEPCQPNHQLGDAMAARDVMKKTEIYRTVYLLNASFAAIVGYCETLEQAGALTPKYQRLFQGFTQEVQAELNLEILEAMDGVEHADWARFGKVREKWEKYLRGPKSKPKKKTAK